MCRARYYRQLHVGVVGHGAVHGTVHVHSYYYDVIIDRRGWSTLEYMCQHTNVQCRYEASWTGYMVKIPLLVHIYTTLRDLHVSMYVVLCVEIPPQMYYNATDWKQLQANKIKIRMCRNLQSTKWRDQWSGNHIEMITILAVAFLANTEKEITTTCNMTDTGTG